MKLALQRPGEHVKSAQNTQKRTNAGERAPINTLSARTSTHKCTRSLGAPALQVRNSYGGFQLRLVRRPQAR